MEIEDLMVGDWVYINDKPEQVTNGTFILEHLTDVFKPIPIDSSLLEKNGFEQCGEGSKHKNYNEQTWFFKDNKNHTVILEYIGWSGEYYHVHGITTINSLHELQHIFKIMKIKKDFIV